ncbi:MAG: hypothetical protein Q4E70_00315 [Candidatus Saccharibacteria bacterium]|nr:hypothetical protein [Candidatus Saccharibacteria bacterium]
MNDDFQKLVYARWQAFPKGYSLSIGGYGTITKDEALKHVSENDEIGKVLIQIEREYFDSIKTGELYEGITN